MIRHGRDSLVSPAKVVVTDNVMAAAGDTAVRFVALGEFNLKDVGTPISLFRAEKQPG